MDNNLGKCLICEEKLADDKKVEITTNASNQTHLVRCKHCGSYVVTYEFERELKRILSDDKESLIQNAMFFAQLSAKDSKTIPYYSADEMEGKDIGSYSYWTIDSLKNSIPIKFSDKVDKTIWGLSQYYREYGKEIWVEHNFLVLLFFWYSMNSTINVDITSFTRNLKLFEEMNYIAPINNNDNNIYSFALTSNAWIRIDHLLSENSIKNQAFIAMWFSDVMDDAREKIKLAIIECGYVPIIIDEKEHNNQIVPEIFYEIKESDFIVADLTGDRMGVYYEAGYAEGLGKQVILTCKKDETKPHFDVAQKSTIFWETEDELYKSLVKRITATVGNRK